MPQFDVYQNMDPASQARYPLLLDVQSDLLSNLSTRAVVPLCPASAMKGKLLGNLTPVLEIDGRPLAMLTPQLAGIAKKQLGPKVGHLTSHRQAIIGALDFLITGI